MNAIVKAPASTAVALAAPSLPDHSGAALYRVSTDAAALCREIVLATSSNIQGRRYVAVEGWQSIALAHGCAASSGDVIRLEDGSVSATGRVVRIDTGTVISSAEGYVGADEATWFGGPVTDKWGKTKILPKRADYAIRAMAQTRAISRACRSAFAHVVVMMNVGLSTTPAEEVSDEGFNQPVKTINKEGQISKPTPQNGTSTKSAVPMNKKYPVLFSASNGAWLAELARVLNAAETEADVVEIGGLIPVRRSLDHAPANIVADINAMLADAHARVKAEDDYEDEAEGDEVVDDRPITDRDPANVGGSE